MNKVKLILSIVLCNLFLHVYMGGDLYYQIKTTKKEHQRLHNLIKDSVIMHNYFEAHYEGGYFEPCEVVVECEKI